MKSFLLLCVTSLPFLYGCSAAPDEGEHGGFIGFIPPIIAFLFACWVFYDAGKKNKSKWWAVLVLFTSIIGLIIYLFQRRKKAKSEQQTPESQEKPWFLS